MNEEILKQFLSQIVNQSLINRENRWTTLPADQQQVLEKILGAIHDIKNNWDKINPEYRPQALDAALIKAAEEWGMISGGNQP